MTGRARARGWLETGLTLTRAPRRRLRSVTWAWLAGCAEEVLGVTWPPPSLCTLAARATELRDHSVDSGLPSQDCDLSQKSASL